MKKPKKPKFKWDPTKFNSAIEAYAAHVESLATKPIVGHAKIFDPDGNLIFEGEATMKTILLGEPLFKYPDGEVHLLTSASRQDAIEQFDRLTAQGFKLDLIAGCYSKPVI